MTPTRQLRALLRLRWQMMRSRRTQAVLLLAPVLVALLLAAAIASPGRIDPDALTAALSAAAPSYLGFGLLAIIAPLTAGGGSEVMPASQLVAYPVRPATQFLGSLVLAPLNLVWVLQLVVLTAETTYLTLGDGSPARGAATTAAYVAACTAGGQALAWFVVGLRQSKRGRLLVRCTVAIAAVGAITAFRFEQGQRILDLSPAPMVVRAVRSTSPTDAAWWPVTAALCIVALASLVLGRQACDWALRRPLDATPIGEDRAVRRRDPASSPLRALVAMDRASVWRAAPLRRGALVLAILPGVAAAGAAVPWKSLAALPGLVAAGAGLLFGINAFCLDGSGAVWLASLPHPPRLLARAKVIVLAETITGAVVLAAVAGAVRAPAPPTAAELTAVVVSGLTCTAVVIALCLRLSVHHPHRADLRAPRDAVTPPGALVAASVRLAGATALIGMTLGASTSAGDWTVPLVLGLPICALSALSIRKSLKAYDEPHTRARIVHVVAAG